VTPDSYCRDLEAYLCRKNEVHLIRITGPAFERVCRWAEEGIPFTVACAGIDRYFERYYRKGPRRRPVRIEFCEADVLDAFDDWRRAVGVAQEREPAAPERRKGSLVASIERAIAQLTALRASSQTAARLDAALERTVRALDQLLPAARARGEAREMVIAQLEALDRALIDDALEAVDESVRARASAEAREQLAPFRERMSRDAYERACISALERQVREHYHLPSIAYP
jgi:hypothetical protein